MNVNVRLAEPDAGTGIEWRCEAWANGCRCVGMADAKREFNKYVEKSGAKTLLAEAVVNLTNAWMSGKVENGPGPWLRDWAHTDAGHGETQGPELSGTEKQQVSDFLTTSGANDLLTRALVELFESDRPADPLTFYRDFFVRQAGPYVPPQSEAAPPTEPAAEPPAASPEPQAESEPAAEAPPVEPETAPQAEPPPEPEAAETPAENAAEGEA